uniref:Uncharacterized protein n=1 Tax=Vespula pensylvanica TaxID=30213 RepID=A0A834N9R8_VESPE|nr:hypothetical protein H0235_015911 [Vespula pensylvanica]
MVDKFRRFRRCCTQHREKLRHEDDYNDDYNDDYEDDEDDEDEDEDEDDDDNDDDVDDDDVLVVLSCRAKLVGGSRLSISAGLSVTSTWQVDSRFSFTTRFSLSSHIRETRENTVEADLPNGVSY